MSCITPCGLGKGGRHASGLQERKATLAAVRDSHLKLAHLAERSGS